MSPRVAPSRDYRCCGAQCGATQSAEPATYNQTPKSSPPCTMSGASPRKGSKITPRTGTPLRSPPKGKLFGVALGNEVPGIISQSLAYLKEKGISARINASKSLLGLRSAGMNEEGLFRLSGSADDVTALRLRWDTGAFPLLPIALHTARCCDPNQSAGKTVDLSKFGVHVIAATLKLYLRELPEPLICERFYSAFITTDGPAVSLDRNQPGS